MKAANIPMYGNIAVYENIALSVYQIDYTLRCLENICQLSSPVSHHELSLRSPLINREDTDICSLTNT